MECPICGVQVPENEIEQHVNKCLESQSSNDIVISEDSKMEDNFDSIYECEKCHNWSPINEIYILECGHKICNGCIPALTTPFLGK